ncbi:MAG TPA: formate dehydrogenase, partial [Sulfobacillus sp.]|nr:formate dehydrogenase [Sulfobacillus sp.]
MPISETPGLNQTRMFEAMEQGKLRGLYVIGENPVDSDANSTHIRKLLSQLDMLVVQDIFLTATAEMA